MCSYKGLKKIPFLVISRMCHLMNYCMRSKSGEDKHPIQKVNGPDQRSNIDEERYFLHLRYNGDYILFWG